MFFNINSKPNKIISTLLSASIFVICVVLYSQQSVTMTKKLKQEQIELAQENGFSTDNIEVENKILPGLPQMWKSLKKAVFEPNVEEEYNEDGEIIPNNKPKTLAECKTWSEKYDMLKDGKWQLFTDTSASGKRVFYSLLFIFASVLIGLYMGMLPYMEKLLYRFVLFFDKIPALAVLPILFIIAGLGETAKIALIVVGVAPTVILDTYLKVKELPREQIIKGFTLHASQHENIYKIVFPQVLPKIIDSIRLQFKAIILFLIAGEALAADAGLGYRIFVVRRYMDMSTIIPYVIIISLAAFLIDGGLRWLVNNRIKWLQK